MTASIFLALSYASAFPATTTLAQYASILEDHGYGSLAAHGVPGFDYFTNQRNPSPESRLAKRICAFGGWISPCMRVSKPDRPPE